MIGYNNNIHFNKSIGQGYVEAVPKIVMPQKINSFIVYICSFFGVILPLTFVDPHPQKIK